MRTGEAVGRAEAYANIALAKYWGKSAAGENRTAVPSLSLTLDGLRTRTEVRFDERLTTDEARLDGALVAGRPMERIAALLDRVRAASGETRRARVTSRNEFPTAAGLASSASGFAALALAASRAAGASLDARFLGDLARRSSASAARSFLGGFVELEADADSATQVAPQDHWDLAMLVAVVAPGPKPMGSTQAMIHTAQSSPYYDAWVADARRVFRRIRQAVVERNFEELTRAMEHSTLRMHATMFAADPPVLYWKGATVQVLEQLRRWREEGLPLGFTLDAGPNVKVLTLPEHAAALSRRLQGLAEVTSVLECRPGPAARILANEGELEAAAPTTEWCVEAAR